MGTPFISCLEPTSLTGYDRTKPPSEQPSHIPKVFLDAMSVREAVFVKEQGVPLENEHDVDDARSCHWVIYASINRVVEPEVRDPESGDVVTPKRSETVSLPIGTMRIVPFPHPPHPVKGGRYVAEVLQQDGDGDGDVKSTLTKAEEARQTAPLPYGRDRETTFHDGREPYVKFGRLAVLPEFRGRRLAGQLWRAARQWLEEHPTYFDPKVSELGLDQLKVGGTASEIPRWNGLVCCHAQEGAVKTYEKWGFRIDEEMGKWWEEGIPHVGMFIRLEVKDCPPRV